MLISIQIVYRMIRIIQLRRFTGYEIILPFFYISDQNLTLSNVCADSFVYIKREEMAGAPPGTAQMIIKEIGIGMVLGYICGAAWKYTYHKDIKRRTNSFYSMLDKGEISVVVSEE